MGSIGYAVQWLAVPGPLQSPGRPGIGSDGGMLQHISSNTTLGIHGVSNGSAEQNSGTLVAIGSETMTGKRRVRGKPMAIRHIGRLPVAGWLGPEGGPRELPGALGPEWVAQTR
jgi:hypothetical protein